MVFLKTRPFVKQNNAEFTNVCSFTLLLMCSTHFTLSCRILLFSLPSTKNFFKFVYSEITGKSAWWDLFRIPSLAVEGLQKLTHFNSGLLISRTFLLHAGTTVTQWLRCCVTNRKVAGSIPAGVIGFFIDIKSFRSHYGPGVDSASNRNEYQEYFLGVKAAGA